MQRSKLETAAVIVAIVGLVASLSYPFVYERQLANPEGYDRIITLTGIAQTGVWTEAKVTGSNYWSESFPRARPRIGAGEKVLLRLKSADVVHRFYLPALGVGPVEVYPGHLSEVELNPKQAGVYEYYCTSVCGQAHFAMRGEVAVTDGDSVELPPTPETVGDYWKLSAPPATASLVEKGGWLFEKWGCVTCHGKGGQGGVKNFNYIKETIPPLNTLAEKLMLFYPEDAEAIIKAIEDGVSMDELAEDPPIPRFNVFRAQYDSVRQVILNGNPPGKKDPHGPEPPLEMLPWAERLDSGEIDAILAYLLTLQEFHEE